MSFCGQSHSSWAWCEKQPVTWHDHQVIQRLQRKLYPPQSGNKIAKSVIGLKTLPWRLRLRLHPITTPSPSSFLSSLLSDRSSIFSFILSLYFDPRAWPNRRYIKRRERKKHPALPISRSNYYWSNYYWSQNLRQCPQGFKKLIYHKRKKKRFENSWTEQLSRMGKVLGWRPFDYPLAQDWHGIKRSS